MTTFLRYRGDEERRTPRGQFPPLLADHPLVGESCMVCWQPFQAGQRPTLFACGPTSLEAAKDADRGTWYTALALPGHEDCWWPEQEPD